MIQEQLFISELFNDIQDVILLILHYRRMLLFRATSSNIFCHIGCAFNLHSIINSGLIPGGQSSSKRQTVFFLPVDPKDKSHKDPKVIDLYHGMQNTFTMHGKDIKTQFFGSTSIMPLKKD